MPRTSSSGRRTGTRSRRRGIEHGLGSRDRIGDPYPARHREQDLLRFLDAIRRAAQQPGVACRSGLSGRAAGAQCRRRSHGRHVRSGDGLHHCTAFRVRAQELLLSGSAQGVPDFPVRTAHRSRRAPGYRRGRRRRQDHRDNPGSPGGRCRQVTARGLPGAQRHRSESRRNTAAGDRVGARPAIRPGGGQLHARHPHAGAVSRHLGRQHAGGIVPLRRQCLHQATGGNGTRHQDGDQESQFLPVRGKGHPGGDRAADRRGRGQRQGGTGNAPVRCRPQRDPCHARQGGSQRLPILPRPGPAPRGYR